ncbi:hypothetical protein [Amycolatopsis vastitatis]|uniref:Uncharacterized protein n=1 Tax=Amycolatopsis vastitatis TaxID=1905142 RepID=A0A229TEQ6_9PSEU|nr:hypothetical protein [Amycolatopsis vastitatis]OXM69648.1 hypothetical protein CF165_09065 [Amycolatopsis vastitatis]
MTRQPHEGKQALAETIALRARVHARTALTLPDGSKAPVPVTRLLLEEVASEVAHWPCYRDVELPALRTLVAACRRQAAAAPGLDILELDQK